MSADGVSELAGKRDAMAKWRKKLANSILGTDIDDLCLAWYEAGQDVGFHEGIQKATDDIVTDVLSDAILSLELDVETMQRIVEIIEN
jgi:5-methylthioribose kinase